MDIWSVLIINTTWYNYSLLFRHGRIEGIFRAHPQKGILSSYKRLKMHVNTPKINGTTCLIRTSVWLPIHVAVCLSFSPSPRRGSWLSMHPSNKIFTILSVLTPVCLSVSPPIRFVCLLLRLSLITPYISLQHWTLKHVYIQQEPAYVLRQDSRR